MTPERALALAIGLLGLLAVGLLELAVHWQWVMVHVSQETGVSQGASRAYDFWSGSGSDIGELALVGGVITVVRGHNCHQKGCWRVGVHTTAKGHKLCKKHVALPNSDLEVHPVHSDHQAQS